MNTRVDCKHNETAHRRVAAQPCWRHGRRQRPRFGSICENDKLPWINLACRQGRHHALSTRCPAARLPCASLPGRSPPVGPAVDVAKAQCDLGSTSSDGAASDGTDRPTDAQKNLPSDEARQRVAVEAPGYPPAMAVQDTAARTTTTTCSCPELAAADADWPSTPAWDA